jgi:hypothetical protein
VIKPGDAAPGGPGITGVHENVGEIGGPGAPTASGTRTVPPGWGLPGGPKPTVGTGRPIEAAPAAAPRSPLVMPSEGRKESIDRFGPPAPAPDMSYTLQPGDVLQIKIMGEADTEASSEVGPDGTISYFNAVKIKATDCTVDKVREKLILELSKYYKMMDPSKPGEAAPVVLHVSVTRYAGSLVTIGGDVAKPGAYPYIGRMRIRDAIDMAGGPTVRTGREERVVVVYPPLAPNPSYFALADLTLRPHDASLNDFVVSGTRIDIVSGDLFQPRASAAVANGASSKSMMPETLPTAKP